MLLFPSKKGIPSYYLAATMNSDAKRDKPKNGWDLDCSHAFRQELLDILFVSR